MKKYLNKEDLMRRILHIISNLNLSEQKLNAIKHLIYEQFEFTPSPSGNEDKEIK